MLALNVMALDPEAGISLENGRASTRPSYPQYLTSPLVQEQESNPGFKVRKFALGFDRFNKNLVSLLHEDGRRKIVLS